MSTNVFDYQYTSIERLAFAGKMYRLGIEKTRLASAGHYVSICFTTPVNLWTNYRFAAVEKAGNDIGITLVEDCVYSGGVVGSPWNLNRLYRDVPSPLENIRIGASNSGTILTVSGGLSAPYRMLAGESNPSSKPGGSQESSGYIVLYPGTRYALKIFALTGSVDVGALVELGCICRATP